MTTKIPFWLNNRRVGPSEPAGMLILDYLRKIEKLTATKEGCKEGDCGACTVLIGELAGDRVHYQVVTSCLVPLGELHGKHLVTVEGINLEGLSPVQQFMVDEGGSQCGYCTPGFIASMTWFLMAEKDLTPEAFKRAISGNLCRCTGYNSIKRAGQHLIDLFGPGGKGEEIWRAPWRIKALVEAKMLPEYFLQMPERLKEIPPIEIKTDRPIDCFVAGGTDIYVQKGEQIPEAKVGLLNLYPEMKTIKKEDGCLSIGALTSFEDFANHSEVQKVIPKIREYMFLIASLQIRNRATLGGNIVNGSPIGDMTILLLALDCGLVLKEGENQRTVALKDFFKGYKVLEKREKEILTEILLPLPAEGTKIHFEKVSKRKCLDIATVNSAAKIQAHGEGIIIDASLTAGGVAPIPLFLKKTSDFLVGKKINSDTIQEAQKVAAQEISPISDVRGSAQYKALLVHQFMAAHFIELYPKLVSFEEMMVG